MKVVDFDGDSRKGIMVRNIDNSIIYQYSASMESFVEIYNSTSFPLINDRVFYGDFNGDKKTDILTWNNGWSLRFSTGTGFEVSPITPSLTNTDPEASSSDYNYYISDINGDSKDDIIEMHLTGSNSSVKIFYSVGNGTFITEDNNYSKSSINQDYITFKDFNGDGRQDMFYYDYSSAANTVSICFFGKDEMKHFVSCISNGMNSKTWISYSRLNRSSDFYTDSLATTFPVTVYNGPYYAVETTKVKDANGVADLLTHYSYSDLCLHKQGKGSLGFKKVITANDVRDSLFTWREYNYDPTYFFIFPSKTSVWYKYKSFTFSEAENTFATIGFGNNIIFPYLSQTISTDMEKGTSVTASFGYDNYGNMTSQSTVYRSGSTVESTKTVANIFDHFGNYGIPNKLISTTSTSVYGTEPQYSRTASYNYDNYGGLITEITDPSTTSTVTKTYSSFNSYGLPTQITLSASSLASRTSLIEYDSKSRFIQKITNPLSHFISKVYEPGTGNLLSETNLDGNVTAYQYDGLGRSTKTITSQGNEIDTQISWDGIYAGGESSVYFVNTTTPKPGKPDLKTYFDVQGRKLMTATVGYDGLSQITQTWTYSANGSLSGYSLPYKSGENVKSGIYKYDFNGRVISEDLDGEVTTTVYNGKTVRVTDPAGKIKTTEFNSLGNPVAVTENDNNIINYTYHSNGQVKSITSSGTSIIYGYDNFGRKNLENNPNSGAASYVYNAYGELISQTDAKNNSFTFQYDQLGRITNKSTPEGSTVFEYVTSGPGIEQPKIITGPGNIIQSYSYTQSGQVSASTESMSDIILTTNYEYDSWGNNTKIIYPSGIRITNVYTDNGYFSEIKKDGNTIWKLNEMNSKGQPVHSVFGSSVLTTDYSYDTKGYLSGIKTGSNEQSFSFNPKTGNLSSRGYGSLSESFAYDNMDRLTTITRQDTPLSISYVGNGNIATKHDAGTYGYDPGKTNTVTSIKSNPNTISHIQQDVTYTSSNMTNTVTEGSNNITYTYGPDNKRIKSILSYNGTVKTKYYTSGFEREIINSSTRDLNYIYSPYGLVAIIIKQDAIETKYWVETDHLGSLIGLYNESGSIVERYSYDAWGRRRDFNTWTPLTLPVTTITDRGFTGHEHLDAFGLINMNGRMYDPVLGRFLGVDPIIQDAGNSQTLNGYSYCLNNPLRYIDPTGYMQVDELLRLMSEGGYNHWNVETGYSNVSDADVIADYVSSYGLPEGSGFSGPGSPYALPEVTVSAKAPEKNVNNQDNRGAMETVYKVANFLNEFNPIANLWDVVAYAFSGNDRFGNNMSLGQGMLKAATVIPVGKVGNISVRTLQLTGRARTAEQGLMLGERFLGNGYNEIAPGVFRSADGLKQFRMTNSDLLGKGFNDIPHIHFERYYPFNLNTPYVNWHVPLINP